MKLYIQYDYIFYKEIFIYIQHIFIIIYAIFLENGNQIYTKEKHWHPIQKLLAVVILGWGRNDFGI